MYRWPAPTRGLGYPELGFVPLSELQNVRRKLGLPVECNLWSEAKGPLFAFAAVAHRTEHIVELMAAA
ncbi:DUF2958 domain-containing protein [Methylobacterium bullatum]|uniref:LysR substrate-binding domain-containing protein n=1 Tax=Methylobacterium bullatum TaxID=570505 RepID=A0AAV4Z9X2_9HYPH|nr:DUF2958 domain-containing protein [Methylobacterium bullatum]GJD40821.1 hypothetical protein OICFNHDK_3297 [Methylobacterium bullatum]